MITASFGDLRFSQIEGYRISAGFQPNMGFRNHFFVYIVDRIRAHEEPWAELGLAKDGPPPRGPLQISGEGRNYQFEDIDLISARIGADRQERFRIVEFNYAERVADRPKSPVRLENTGEGTLAKGNLPDKYSYSIKERGDAEYLLGFEARPAPNGPTVLRFSALRNKSNSFLEEIVAINQERVANGGRCEFTIGFGFAPEGIKINTKNLRRCFVMESFGECLSWPTFPLSRFALGDSMEMARVEIPSADPRELLDRKDGYAAGSPAADHPETVETATLIVEGFADLPVV